MLHAPPRHRDLAVVLAVVPLLCPGTAWAAGNVVLEAAASFHGEQAEEYVGAVSGLGDVNGDGLDDFYVGSWRGGEGGGAAYLFFGRHQLWSLDTLVSAADVVVYGEGPSEGVGYAWPQTHGDLDGDGLNDLIIDDIWNDDVGNNAGQVYVLFGKESDWAAEVPVADADASFLGENTGDYAGFWRILGDLDGDGIDDMAVGSEMYSGAQGCTYLVFGSPTGWTTGQSLADADRRYTGENVQDHAAVLGGGGDVDGDGFDDLLVGAPGVDANGNNAGAAYLVAGRPPPWPASGTIGNPQLLHASFLGEQENDIAGYTVSIVKDVSGDGLDDLLIGAPDNSEAGYLAGQAYLVLGRTTGWVLDMDLALADASFPGQAGTTAYAYQVADAGDMNGDGLHEIAVGSLFDSEFGQGTGQTFLWLGRSTAWNPDMTQITADASFAGDFIGEDSGELISSPGDVDGDGLDELLVGARYNGDYGENSGAAYLILGTPCFDVDWDGVNACGGPAQDPDCDDTNPLTYPGAPEQCDGTDNDCDEEVDEGTDEDLDGDGFTACEGDCHGEDPAVFPLAPEICDGKDNDCDGAIPLDEADLDGDGVRVCAGDCDDTQADVHPEHEEICDDLDNNCDGEVDEGFITEWYRDDDGDGWGRRNQSREACEQPSPYVAVCGDCDDDDPSVHPDAVEVCDDNKDNDCDGHPDAWDDECPDLDDDDDSADDDAGDDDTTEIPDDDCDCRSEIAPGVHGSVAVVLLAVIGLLLRTRTSSR